MLDRQMVLTIFSDLRSLVANEPQLSGFVPAAKELVMQAEALARGEQHIPLIESLGRVPVGPDLPEIPNEKIARALRTTFDRLPSHGPDEDEGLAAAYRTLLRNAAVSVLFAIFEQFPQIIPTVPENP